MKKKVSDHMPCISGFEDVGTGQFKRHCNGMGESFALKNTNPQFQGVLNRVSKP